MRIIAGQAKGHPLKVPRKVSRPTTDRVRESIFGILSPVLEGARVLDLFAGSGALGLEALSRGASSCVFVEQDRGACRVIKENLAKTGLAGGEVKSLGVERFLKGRPFSFDLIFADPPYADGLRDPVRDLVGAGDWRGWLAEDGFLLLEQAAAEETMALEGLEVVQSRGYGKSRMTIYQAVAGS